MPLNSIEMLIYDVFNILNLKTVSNSNQVVFYYVTTLNYHVKARVDTLG